MASICTTMTASALATVVASSASAATFDPAMYSAPDPASFGTLLAELDIATTSYNFPFNAGLFSGSGYVSETGGFEFDRTELVSRVFSVTAPQTFTMGSDSIDLNVGDLVFSYEIRLVEDSTTTVETLAEFQVGAFGGLTPFDGSVVKGRGFFSTGPEGPLGGNATDLTVIPGLGGAHDWSFDIDPANQLQNDETITLLMFTEPTFFTEGLGSMRAPSGQVSDRDPNAAEIPVLIPAIPSPAGVAVFAIAGLAGAARRRR
jgi:hypothetical protein